MRFLKLILLLAFSMPAFGGEITLGSIDQKKLGELLGRLPLSVRERIIKKRILKKELSVKSLFPVIDSPFVIKCESTYYNGSSVFTSSKCSMNVDHLHPEVETNFDEYKIRITDREIVEALFANISYQNDFKELRSYGKTKGRNFDGKETFIFNYYFKCSREECILKVSRKADPSNLPVISREVEEAVSTSAESPVTET